MVSLRYLAISYSCFSLIYFLSVCCMDTLKPAVSFPIFFFDFLILLEFFAIIICRWVLVNWTDSVLNWWRGYFGDKYLVIAAVFWTCILLFIGVWIWPACCNRRPVVFDPCDTALVSAVTAAELPVWAHCPLHSKRPGYWFLTLYRNLAFL